MNQNRTPLFTAVKNYVEDRVFNSMYPVIDRGRDYPS
jgi:hypothetical protein